jgi:ATP-dependent Clp protease adaptor protein ClpS
MAELTLHHLGPSTPLAMRGPQFYAKASRMMLFEESAAAAADDNDDAAADDNANWAGVATVVPQTERQESRQANRQPRYNVLIWDSDDHTFEYVEKMLRELFGHQKQQCQKIAEQVDKDGRAVVLTTTKEHAELKRDQIHAYGKDDIESSKGSMWSTIEAVE